jgi:hypothetical protein
MHMIQIFLFVIVIALLLQLENKQFMHVLVINSSLPISLVVCQDLEKEEGVFIGDEVSLMLFNLWPDYTGLLLKGPIMYGRNRFCSLHGSSC